MSQTMKTQTDAQRAVNLSDGSRYLREASAIALGGVFLSGDTCRWLFPDGSTIVHSEDYSRPRLYEVGPNEQPRKFY